MHPLWELLVNFFLVWPGGRLDATEKRRVALGCLIALALGAAVVWGLAYALG
ncbi:hypothetical protein [Rhodocaloribacter sp.]